MKGIEALDYIPWPTDLLNYSIPRTLEGKEVTAAQAKDADGIKLRSGQAARAYPKRGVERYSDLVRIVSNIASVNGNLELYYRGQHRDYGCEDSKNGQSSLMPTLWRAKSFEDARNELIPFGRSLSERFDGIYKDDVARRKVIESQPLAQWSLLQHYEICPTPLLDITKSLQVACSFALEGSAESGYLYILGMPYVSGRIGVDEESGLTILDLLGIAPGDALRPHFQEGYLATRSDWWRLFSADKKDVDAIKKGDGCDFSRRLLCKLKLGGGDDFWDVPGISALGSKTLMPKNDPFKEELMDTLQVPMAEGTILRGK